MLAPPELVDPRRFTLDDGSVYQRIPAAELPDGDTWDSVVVESERLTREAAATRVRSLVSVVSQNGWSANDRSVIASFTIPGTRTRVALRAGDCSVLLLDFLAWFNREIEPIDGDTLDDWGYAERLIRGSATTVSNHGSGTAADHNALRHALGKVGTFTAAQLAKIRARIALYRGALRHGAFYTGRLDAMHVEVNAGPKLVRQVADDIRAGRLGGIGGQPGISTPTAPTEEDPLSALTADEQRELLDDVRIVTKWLRGYDPTIDALQKIGLQTTDIATRVRGYDPNIDSLQALSMGIANLAALVVQGNGQTALTGVPTADLRGVATALADELDRRARDGDPATGPVT